MTTTSRPTPRSTSDETANQVAGVYTVVVTPFTSDASALDESVIPQLVNRQVDAGVDGIIAGGSMGEFTALSTDERRRLAEAVVAAVNGRVPVLIGVSAFTTREVIDLARHAAGAGANGLMIMPLGFWRLSAEEVLTLFGRVSDACDLPIMAYNNPIKAGGTDLVPDLLANLAERTQVQSVKETSFDIHRVQEIVNLCGERVSVLTGDDAAALSSLAVGATGWVPGISNVVPFETAALLSLFRQSRWPAAAKLHGLIVDLRKSLEAIGNPVATMRSVLTSDGVAVGPPRQPLAVLTPAEAAMASATVQKFRERVQGDLGEWIKPDHA